VSLTEPPFVLRGLRHHGVSALLNRQSALLESLVDGLGSPLHVLLPEVFEENVTALREVFAQSGAAVDILFAKKANKADCYVRSAAQLGVGVDVASVPELIAALAGGVPGHRIGVSGPEKDDTLHTLAVHHGCLVAVDSLSELRRLTAAAARARTTVRVLLRARPGSQPRSRFGMSAEELHAAVGLCEDSAVTLRGFSFHLSGYSTAERAKTADEMIDHCLHARRHGSPSAEIVDIGGGLPVRYVDPHRWDAFLHQNQPGHYHTDREIEDFYPYGGQPAVEAARDIMTHPVNDRDSLAQRAARDGVRFVVEPGRALLDQAGFTMFRVQQADERDGYAIVTVTGSSFSLSEQWFGSEYLPDPELLAARPVGGDVFPACVAGSTWLESDMLTWRKIAFPRPVRPGDHLVYLNTAGYQMDSNESPFHDAPLPRKVVIRTDGDGSPRWRLDGL
jgi:diaminopimelate decarboxylase